MAKKTKTAKPDDAKAYAPLPVSKAIAEGRRTRGEQRARDRAAWDAAQAQKSAFWEGVRQLEVDRIVASGRKLSPSEASQLEEILAQRPPGYKPAEGVLETVAPAPVRMSATELGAAAAAGAGEVETEMVAGVSEAVIVVKPALERILARDEVREALERMRKRGAIVAPLRQFKKL